MEDFSPKRPIGMSSPMRPRLLTQRSTPSAIDSSRVLKYQQPRLAEELMIRQIKPSLQRYVDHLTGDPSSNEIRESSLDSEAIFTSLALLNKGDKESAGSGSDETGSTIRSTVKKQKSSSGTQTGS